MIVLLRCVDLSTVPSVIDPFCGTGTIARVLAAGGVKCCTNDINPQHAADTHADALQPGFYQRMSVAAVVTSPLFAVLDVALPLAVHSVTTVACIHVPGHFVTNGHLARMQYLQRLKQQGRLHIVYGLPRGPLGQRCAWLLVFRTPEVKRQLLAPSCQADADTTFWIE